MRINLTYFAKLIICLLLLILITSVLPYKNSVTFNKYDGSSIKNESLFGFCYKKTLVNEDLSEIGGTLDLLKKEEKIIDIDLGAQTWLWKSYPYSEESSLYHNLISLSFFLKSDLLTFDEKEDLKRKFISTWSRL